MINIFKNNNKPQSISVGDIKDSNVNIHQVTNIGYTPEMHERILKERIAEIRADLLKAHESEKAPLIIQLEAAQKAVIQLNASYNLRLNELSAQLIKLQELCNQVSDKAFDDARAALLKGDSKLADNLYAEIEKQGLDTAAKAVFQRGRIAYEEIRWLDAINHFEKANDLVPNHINYKSWLAYLYERTGNYHQAQVLLETLIVNLTESTNYSCNDLAKVKNSLARIYDLLDNPAEAEKLFLDAINTFTRVDSPDKVGLINTYNNLAQLYCKNVNYHDAEHLYLILVDEVKNLYGECSSDLATVYSNLGNVYLHQKSYAESEKLLLKAIQIHKISSNLKFSNLGSAFNNLAYLYLEQSNYPDAEIYIKLAIALDEPIFGVQHPKMAIYYSNLARMYQAKGLNDLAETQYKKALNIRLKCLPNKHQELIINFSNLGDIYFAKKQYEYAEVNYEEALSILKKRSELYSANSEKILQNYARCLEIQGKETEHLLEEFVQIATDKL